MTNERDRHFSSEINNRHRDLTWGANVVGNSPNERSIRRLPGLVWSAIRLVWASGRREFCLSIGIRLLGGIATAIQLLTVKQMLSLTMAARQRGTFGSIVPSVLLFGGAILVQSLAASIEPELQRVLGDLVSRRSAASVLDVTCAAPLEAFENPAFHDRLQRAEMGAGLRPWQITQSLLGIVGAAAGLGAIIVALLLIQPILLVLVVLAVVPVWAVTALGAKAFYRYFFQMTPNDRRRHYLRKTMTERDSAKELIAFGLADFLRAKWERLYAERIAELRILVRKHVKRQILASLATSVLTLMPLLLLAYLVITGDMSLPEAISGAAAIVILRPNLGAFLNSAGQLYEGSLFMADYSAFLRLKPQSAPAKPTMGTSHTFQRLRLEEVSFAYPTAGRLALRKVSLDIEMGQVVALVGENGSGKTTLAKLVAGLYQPQSGRLLWDGTDSRDLDPAELRASITIIFQDFVRYLLLASENIAVGDHARCADGLGIRTAARQAGADEFLAALPEGYSTLLAPEFDGGKDLSVGQWQRVALARAYFRNTPLIILDEPTAALDARAEYELFANIRTLFQGRAVLLISHRFSTVRSADQIYVLQEGSIVDCGTHQALLDHGGLYSELFGLQAEAYSDGTHLRRGR